MPVPLVLGAAAAFVVCVVLAFAVVVDDYYHHLLQNLVATAVVVPMPIAVVPVVSIVANVDCGHILHHSASWDVRDWVPWMRWAAVAFAPGTRLRLVYVSCYVPRLATRRHVNHQRHVWEA